MEPGVEVELAGAQDREVNPVKAESDLGISKDLLCWCGFDFLLWWMRGFDVRVGYDLLTHGTRRRSMIAASLDLGKMEIGSQLLGLKAVERERSPTLVGLIYRWRVLERV
jgi:hypothetical protein